MRGVSDAGEVWRRSETEVETVGSPDEVLLEAVGAEPLPAVSTEVGQQSMAPEEREAVDRRLAQLGYK